MHLGQDVQLDLRSFEKLIVWATCYSKMYLQVAISTITVEQASARNYILVAAYPRHAISKSLINQMAVLLTSPIRLIVRAMAFRLLPFFRFAHHDWQRSGQVGANDDRFAL